MLYFFLCSFVSVWSPKTGKIVNKLEHDLQDEQLAEVVCFDDRVVTVTNAGSLTFWDLSKSQPERIEQISVSNFQKLVSFLFKLCFNYWSIANNFWLLVVDYWFLSYSLVLRINSFPTFQFPFFFSSFLLLCYFSQIIFDVILFNQK